MPLKLASSHVETHHSSAHQLKLCCAPRRGTGSSAAPLMSVSSTTSRPTLIANNIICETLSLLCWSAGQWRPSDAAIESMADHRYAIGRQLRSLGPGFKLCRAESLLAPKSGSTAASVARGEYRLSADLACLCFVLRLTAPRLLPAT